jgi:hypothetical protein
MRRKCRLDFSEKELEALARIRANGHAWSGPGGVRLNTLQALERKEYVRETGKEKCPGSRKLWRFKFELTDAGRAYWELMDRTPLFKAGDAVEIGGRRGVFLYRSDGVDRAWAEHEDEHGLSLLKGRAVRSNWKPGPERVRIARLFAEFMRRVNRSGAGVPENACARRPAPR